MPKGCWAKGTASSLFRCPPDSTFDAFFRAILLHVRSAPVFPSESIPVSEHLNWMALLNRARLLEVLSSLFGCQAESSYLS